MDRKFYTVAVSNTLNSNTPSDNTAISFTVHNKENINFDMPMYCEKKEDKLVDIITGRVYKIKDTKDLEEDFYAKEVYLHTLEEINRFYALRTLELVDKTVLLDYLKELDNLESKCKEMYESHLDDTKKI